MLLLLHFCTFVLIVLVAVTVMIIVATDLRRIKRADPWKRSVILSGLFHRYPNQCDFYMILSLLLLLLLLLVVLVLVLVPVLVLVLVVGVIVLLSLSVCFRHCHCVGCIVFLEARFSYIFSGQCNGMFAMLWVCCFMLCCLVAAFLDSLFVPLLMLAGATFGAD